MSKTQNHIPVEEAIKRLKAEVIAQDWRLSPKRAASLEDAFQCLRRHFNTRKAMQAMLIMAGSVLEHIRKRNGKPPETIDFLKEAMAHIVSLYEDLDDEPEREKAVFDTLFKRFQGLKQKIKNHGHPEVKKPSPLLTVDLTTDILPPSEPDEHPRAKSAPAVSLPQQGPDNESVQVELLITELQKALEKAGEAGSAIKMMLAEALNADAAASPPRTSKAGAEAAAENSKSARAKTPIPAPAEPCPATDLRELVMNGIHLALPAECVALTQSIKPAIMRRCLTTNQLPLKYLSGFMQRLAPRLNSRLSELKERKLKKISLPLIIPRGVILSARPDKEASILMIISHDNWHGVLACAEVNPELSVMTRFAKQRNGDIAGIGYIDDERQVMVLDALQILKREGFLLLAD